jgi:hypothetical protein
LKGLSLLDSILDFFFDFTKDAQVGEASPHIANIGRLVEDMENKIRSDIKSALLLHHFSIFSVVLTQAVTI